MAQAFGDAGEQIGQHLRRTRKERRLTLTAVGQMTGVSPSALSKIENGLVSPSFDIIKRICDGLDLPIEDLVAPGVPQEQPQVLGRKTTTRGGDGARFTSGQYDYRAHATELSRKGMVPLEMLVRARSVEEFDHWSRHNGEEFVYVLSGAIEVHTEFYAPFRLEAGESGYFDSSMAHLYISVSPEDARVLSVSYDPEQGKRQLSAFMNASARPIAAKERAPARRKTGAA
ncbi:XRE family transcriptional regulator [Xanthobacter sp. KR7-65]|uniref:helix-turn-helix domain-containing protein n=1 Tax=Xanthobacter sp. KR7-65 TaxID=3156612 RepID=UPI0032B51DA1